jgi:glycerophosphoryl diester phosphodiesterase
MKIFTFLITFLLLADQVLASEPPVPKYIAHAGGGVNGNLMYTNSLEALNGSYKKGLRYIEVDLETTSDGRLILLHDWDFCMRVFFNTKVGVKSYDQFKSLSMKQGLTIVSFREFVDWLKDKPDVYIITDSKRNPVKNLQAIAKFYPQMIARTIPQIYKFEEYKAVKNLGYKNMILTLYQSNYTAKEIIKFAKKNKLWAISISTNKIKETDLASKITEAIDTPLLAHPVNNEALITTLSDKKISGFYTAFLPNVNKTNSSASPTNLGK